MIGNESESHSHGSDFAEEREVVGERLVIR